MNLVKIATHIAAISGPVELKGPFVPASGATIPEHELEIDFPFDIVGPIWDVLGYASDERLYARVGFDLETGYTPGTKGGWEEEPMPEEWEFIVTVKTIEDLVLTKEDQQTLDKAGLNRYIQENHEDDLKELSKVGLDDGDPGPDYHDYDGPYDING